VYVIVCGTNGMAGCYPNKPELVASPLALFLYLFLEQVVQIFYGQDDLHVTQSTMSNLEIYNNQGSGKGRRGRQKPRAPVWGKGHILYNKN